ncbi:MAG: hypothetical protein ACRYG7_50455 [Janthinobacterium lividum]
MNNEKVTLVGLSYGREQEYKRLIFAVLSFKAFYSGIDSNVQLLIFTDNSAYFEHFLTGILVKYVLLTPAKIELMKGPQKFVHLVKVEVIREAFELYPNNNLVYIDSDTFFIKDPLPLFGMISAENSLMHTKEYALTERIGSTSEGNSPQLFLSALKNRTFSTSQGEERYFPSQYSWNAGVIGLAKEGKGYIDDIYKLSGEFFSCSLWHISEQLAFSLLLQTRTTIYPCEKYIYHYWASDKKIVIDTFLSKKLDRAFTELDLQEKIINIAKMSSAMLLRELAMDTLAKGNMFVAYKYAAMYLSKAGFDIKFLRDVIYRTRNLGYFS